MADSPSRPTMDRARVEHVAQLASLTLSPAEAETLTHELAAIVRYVEELSTLDTTDVPATAHVQLEASVLRSDEVHEGLAHDVALSQAPRKDHGGFAVPAFVE